MKQFTIEKHTHVDKYFEVVTPGSYEGGLRIRIDYDDVDHKLVDQQTKRMVDILNKYWSQEDKEIK